MATPKTIRRDVRSAPLLKKAPESTWMLYLVDFRTLSIILFFFICLTCFLYLSEFNDISSQGVLINRLERERSELMIENEVWNMRIARLKSLDVIEKQDVVRRMEFIRPEEVEFVDLDRLRQDLGSASD